MRVKLTTKDIPQGDSLHDVILYIQNAQKGSKFTVQPRTEAYYVASAKILGFLDKNGTITAKGIELLQTSTLKQLPLLKRAFVESKVGRYWCQWANKSLLAEVPAESAMQFLEESLLSSSQSTIQRRAKTLSKWHKLLFEQTKETPRLKQLSLWDAPIPKKVISICNEEIIPNNDGFKPVQEVLKDDFQTAHRIMIISGYTSLTTIIEECTRFPKEAKVQLLFGNEPKEYTGRISQQSWNFPQEVKEYWLKNQISIVQASRIMYLIHLLEEDRIAVRIHTQNKPLHAKIYLTEAFCTLGSSNFSQNGLKLQSEANARFHRSQDYYLETEKLAEHFWSVGEDWKQALIDILQRQLRVVSWQEALARGCAEILEGAWAKDYTPANASEVRPLWFTQQRGFSEGLSTLFEENCLLVADATGSGKTWMGAWILRALHDHLHRKMLLRKHNRQSLEPIRPVCIVPPGVQQNWIDDLRSLHLQWDVHSHGGLSASKKKDDRPLVLKQIQEAQVLIIDEAHNFLNKSSRRTKAVLSNLAEYVVLFTATPINKGATDIKSIVRLLGADRFSDEQLKSIQEISSNSISTEQVEALKKSLKSFLLRRTRSKLNVLAQYNWYASRENWTHVKLSTRRT